MSIFLSRKAITKIQAVVVVVVVVLAAVGTYAYLGTIPKPPVTVKFAEVTWGESLDPAEGYGSSDVKYYRTMYSKMLRYERLNMSQKIEGELAESWTVSEDGLVFTLKLRQGVTFHDGTTLNASAVKFTFERVKALGFGPSWTHSYWNRIETPDAYTVQIFLDKPYAPYLSSLASQWTATWVVSPTCVKAHATSDDPWAHNWLKEQECGSGPYMLDHWTRSQELTVVKFPGYWEGWQGPHIDTVVFVQAVTESATRRLMLEKGDLDITMDFGFSPTDKLALGQESGMSLYKLLSLNNLYIFFNSQKEPTKNADVRRAISYAIDYQAIVNDIMLGAATQSQGPLPRSLWGHDPNLLVYSKDPAKAAKLLDDAGYPVGKAGPGLRMELTILYWQGNEEERKDAEFVQSELAQIGIKVNISSGTYASIMDQVHGQPQLGPDMVFLYWYPDFADPDSYLSGQFLAGQLWNMGFYNDTRIDAMILAAAIETDSAKRLQQYSEIQRILVDDAWALYLYDLGNWCVLRSWVKNYYYNPIYHDTYDFWYMYVQK
jgi:peptide/nickel transport system substrate-binding protein